MEKRVLAAISLYTFFITAVCAQKATYYADRFHGRMTANGEVYDRTKLTCAHNSYPYGTLLKVTNKGNGKAVTVKVNDRGKLGKGVVIDLSRRAAEHLDMIVEGKVPVTIEEVKTNRKKTNKDNGIKQVSRAGNENLHGEQ